MSDRPSRRRVLQASAAALPFLAAHPAQALSPIKQAQDKLRVGVIGCGVRARALLNGMGRTGKLHTVTCCDVDTTRREDFVTRINAQNGDTACVGYNDHLDMLEAEDLDAVCIATPDHWHAIQIIHAANRGLHIYCEKPLTHTLLESQRIIEAVRTNGVVFQTGSQQRTDFGRRFLDAAERVRLGMIGNCRIASGGVGPVSRPCGLPEEAMEPGLDWDRWLGPTAMRPYNSVMAPRGVHNHFPRWRDYREWAGGLLADFGAHHFDIAQWGFDKDYELPVRITPPVSRRDQYGCTVKWADGKELIHGGRDGTNFIGTTGAIQVSRPRLEAIPADLFDQPLPEGAEPFHRPANHMQDWVDCIASGNEPIAHVDAGARTAAICHLMAIAYWTGKTLNFNPETWRFDDDEANVLLDYERREGYELPEITAPH